MVAETVRAAPDPRVINWLNAQRYDTMYICAPTAAELVRGAMRLPEWQRKNREGVAPEDKILKAFEKRILAFDIEAALAYGAVSREVRWQGLSISRKGAQVAAVAKSYGLRVACMDATPFLRAGLFCVEPWVCLGGGVGFV